ncbi:MAG: hypothetical protein QOJ83_1333, partial [Frankiales bacterium]|nr:hypothetical protein [Frankiales bacterium]
DATTVVPGVGFFVRPEADLLCPDS